MYTRRTKIAAIVAAATVAVTGLGTATASAQELPGTTKVHNGMLFTPKTDGSVAYCTMGVVGEDKYGRKIGITAGHCVSTPDHPFDETNITEDSMPVYDYGNLDWKEGGTENGSDPIGYYRWFKDADGAGGGHATRDYAIIEFVPEVTLSSQGPHIKMDGIYAGGTLASPHATAPAEPREKIVNTAWFNNPRLYRSSEAGSVGNPGNLTFGNITNYVSSGFGTYQSWAVGNPGNSGGPAAFKTPGTPDPTNANGAQMSGQWVGIYRGVGIGVPVYTYTSAANILADLRTRDLASGHDGSVAGAGFQLTTNP